MTPVTGKCNCGAISIEFPKMPDICVKCHCQSCRVSSGGLFSVNLPIPRSEVTISGTPKIYLDNDTSSGKPVHRNFCGDCGCAILSTTEAEEHKMAYVKGGLFTKQGIALPPCKMEVFWHRREEWEQPTEGVVTQ